MRTFLLLIAMLSFGNINSQSKIKGVVTYFFNKYQGDKPDIGSTVYVIDSTKIKNFDESIYNKFYKSKSYLSIYNNYSNLITQLETQNKLYEGKKRYKEYYDKNIASIEEFKKNRDDAYTNLVKEGAETPEKFKEIDRQTMVNFMNIIDISDKTETTNVDGAGNFEISLPPGTYYVVIKSKGRTGLSVTEIKGRVFYKKVKVVKDKVTDVSTNFDI